MLEINPTAPAKAAHDITINASRAVIWNLLTDIDGWTRWNPAVQRARLDGPLAPGAVFRWKSGGVAIVSTIREVQPQKRLVWTGKAFGTQAVHVWSLAETPAGVTVSTAESFDGWLVKLLPGMMQKSLDAALREWLSRLRDAAESAGPRRV